MFTFGRRVSLPAVAILTKKLYVGTEGDYLVHTVESGVHRQM
jgi:hypothetical protein